MHNSAPRRGRLHSKSTAYAPGKRPLGNGVRHCGRRSLERVASGVPRDVLNEECAETGESTDVFYVSFTFVLDDGF
eukprot:3948624-Pyramimonas_sp.AAC.1